MRASCVGVAFLFPLLFCGAAQGFQASNIPERFTAKLLRFAQAGGDLSSINGQWTIEDTGEVLEITAGVWLHPAKGRARIRTAGDAADFRVFYEEQFVKCAYRFALGDRGNSLELMPADNLQDSDYCPTGTLKRVQAGVRLEHVEVIQAVQNIAHTVPLVAEKRSWVRAYFSTSGDQPQRLTATITGRYANSETVSITSNGPATVKPGISLPQQREDWSQSANFLIPQNFTHAGQESFTISGVKNDPDGGRVGCEQCDLVRQVEFISAPPLRLKIVGLQYTGGNPAARQTPRPIDFSLLRSWLLRAYPVSRVISSSIMTEAAAPWPFSCEQANAQLASLRAADIASGGDTRTHYYGLVFNGGGFMRGCASGVPQTPDPETVASGPTGPGNLSGSTGPTYGDWYGGHELAHTFGRLHPGFCNGNSADDKNFPYPNGQISDAKDSVIGLDTGDAQATIKLTVLGGTKHFDIMTYCNQPQWLSDYNYRGVLKRLQDEQQLSGSSAPQGELERVAGSSPASSGTTPLRQGSFIHVTATVNMTRRTGKIALVTPVQQAAQLKAGGGEAELRLLSDRGAVLERYPVALRESSDAGPGEDRKALIDAAIPFNEAATKLQLVLNGQAVDEFEASPRQPAAPSALRLTNKVTPQGTLSTTDRTLAWSPGAAGDKVTYTVQTSADGVSWETVSVGLTNPSLPLGEDQGDKKFVRIIATNGFRASPPVVLPMEK
jgi:hypothetical protein